MIRFDFNPLSNKFLHIVLFDFYFSGPSSIALLSSYADSDQSDTDEDTFGDVCDANDDKDRDGIPDTIDNCVSSPNADQHDMDEDGSGDECDPDADNDGIPNERDNCWLKYNPQQMDANGDGKGDICDDDADGDNIVDFADNCPNNSKIYATDFRTYQTVVLDPHGDSQIDPNWVIYNKEQQKQFLLLKESVQLSVSIYFDSQIEQFF